MRRTFVGGRSLVVPTLALAAVFACSSGGGDGGPSGPGNGGNGGNGLPQGDVTLTASNTFNPQNFTIQAGGSVTWVNSRSIAHTITPDGHAEFSRQIVNSAGQTFTATFDEPGVYPYFCEFHGGSGFGMWGTITVN